MKKSLIKGLARLIHPPAVGALERTRWLFLMMSFVGALLRLIQIVVAPVSPLRFYGMAAILLLASYFLVVYLMRRSLIAPMPLVSALFIVVILAGGEPAGSLVFLYPSLYLLCLYGRGPTAILTIATLVSAFAAGVLLAPKFAINSSAFGIQIVIEQAFSMGLAGVGISVLARSLARQDSSAEELRELHNDRRKLLDRSVRVAEDERRRLAADLHDGPIQGLTAAGYRTELAILALEEQSPEDSSRQLTQLRELIEAEIRALRQLMSNLRPPALDERGLEAALRDQLVAFSARSGIHFDVHCDVMPRMVPEIEIVLFRVAQESLVNVESHSGAQLVDVSLTAPNGSVDLVISDNGRGFDPANSRSNDKGDHYGLLAMKERVDMAGGQLFLKSVPGAGTTIRASFPRNAALIEKGEVK